MIRAVFFDVDFTLIYPGPTFRGEGYRGVLRAVRHGRRSRRSSTRRSPQRRAAARRSGRRAYDAEIFVAYTRRIIERMGGAAAEVDACAREIYDEWAACQHFELYDDVPDVLRELVAAGVRIGLISNSHRCLASFQSHFELAGPDRRDGVVVRARVHEAASEHLRGGAAAGGRARRPTRVMVGDSLRHDVEGALGGRHARGPAAPGRADASGSERDLANVRPCR